MNSHTAPVTYASPHTVTLSVNDWLGIRTQLGFAEFNNRMSGEVATAEVTRELLDKLDAQTDAVLDAAAETAAAEDDAVYECDCCGKPGILARCFVTGIETFACEECRS
jgi:glycerol-3-phosphate dehydrogenase